jgi:hypothetical protein
MRVKMATKEYMKQAKRFSAETMHSIFEALVKESLIDPQLITRAVLSVTSRGLVLAGGHNVSQSDVDDGDPAYEFQCLEDLVVMSFASQGSPFYIKKPTALEALAAQAE